MSKINFCPKMPEFNSNDYGEWELSRYAAFSTGDIFILGTHGPDNKNVIYQLKYYRINMNSDLYFLSKKGWEADHFWNLSERETSIRLLLNKNILNQTNHYGMNCKRCNMKNDWAISNQKDGSYICFECR